MHIAICVRFPISGAAGSLALGLACCTVEGHHEKWVLVAHVQEDFSGQNHWLYMEVAETFNVMITDFVRKTHRT